MSLRLRTSPLRALQIGLQILLLVCLGQVIWWSVDQTRYSAEVREGMTDLYAADQRAAELLLSRAVQDAAVAQIFPHLEVKDGQARIRAEAVAQLDADRYHRLRRYGWEGGFFIMTLVVCMAVVWRALREETLLTQRQRNFVAAVSHEFKSPLASLQLSAETMTLRELPPERRKVLVQRILDDVQRLEEMASKILNSSRLDEARIRLSMESISLAPSVRTAIEGLEARARKEGVRFVSEVPRELRVIADPASTQTVVQNLLENAFKATAAAGGGRIEVRAFPESGWVVLQVRDEGVGFDPKEAKRLFQKFYRTGDEMRRTSTGTGLGLYLVDRLMHHQKGRVQAYSEGPGKGAVFTSWWPPAKEKKA